uniref:class I SAM-dependent methyltransferase n=1 Tax=Algoriphagus sp. TaxID=1872435 RepID=UPI0040481D80
METNWIFKQTEINVAQWDNAMETFHPESTIYLRNADEYVKRLCIECNYLDAVKVLDWNQLIKPDSVVLDLACGGGWLSAFLSTFNQVKSIYSLDSSKRFLSELLFPTTKNLNGVPDKITAIEGLFSPILFDDSSLDIVVSSSSLHHAESLEGVLKEIRRVLKNDGILVILNETPYSNLKHILSSTRTFLRILKKLIFKQYVSSSASVSACGHLYDPNLGDKNYPSWYWKEAIIKAGFKLVEEKNTNMPTVKGAVMPGLTHFVCKAV